MSIVIPYPEPEGVQPDTLERDINIASTQEFINADPINVVLSARNTEPDGAGGFRLLPSTDRMAQVFRLLPQTDVMPSVQGPDGTTYTPTYVLLGLPHQTIGQWDKFEFNGVKFMVVSPVRPDVRLKADAYQIKADVARL